MPLLAGEDSRETIVMESEEGVKSMEGGETNVQKVMGETKKMDNRNMNWSETEEKQTCKERVDQKTKIHNQQL